MPEPIKLIFLGTGSSVPTIKRNHPAILLIYKGEYILFDCGEGTQLQIQKAGLSPLKINKIFITHWHADHFSGLLPLIETMHLENRKKPLEIYGPDATRFVDSLIELSYWSIGFPLKVKDCKDNKILFSNNDYEIFCIKVKHNVPAYGYCFKEKDHWNIDIKKAHKFNLSQKDLKEIKNKGIVRNVKLQQIAKKTEGRKIVYSGDTKETSALFKVARNADVLIHDSTFIDNAGNKDHSCAIRVAQLAKKYNIKKLILTHFSKRYKTNKEIADAVKPIFKNTIVAKDLMKVII
ncbi:MAG: ribonuclease Z [Candidatus Aenigmarchaeota archaeon]|nr:ribonuclease Z [Candidatus Aenigmarchaeota archaeon]